MVEQDDDLDAVFRALAAPARRQILAALRDGPKSVGELAEPLDMSFAGASKHVGVLESARLLTRTKDGRSRICTLRPDRLSLVEGWLKTYTSFWNERLDALERAIEGGGHD
jgi:DNA-binding transcriptional ArsR family regulator